MTTVNRDLSGLDCLAGGGEVGSLMRAMDWSKSPLGPVADWPQSLKTAMRLVLTSRQPMFVWWGRQLINLYNDPYRSILGGKHPAALGQPASHVWGEIWDQVGPRVESALRENEGTYDEALLLIMERNGYPEETYYTFSYSPFPNDDGARGGIFCANTDDTQRIIGGRQTAALRELAAATAEVRTYNDVVERSLESLKNASRDVLFALIYFHDAQREELTLAGSMGLEAGSVAAPRQASLKEPTLWPFVETLASHKPTLVTLEHTKFGKLPTGDWNRPSQQAVLMPLALAGHLGKMGVLVVGLNPYRLFSDDYRGFVDLVATQISAGLANAQAYEEERKRSEALAELDRAKTTFFSNVSHEFRTPLTLMLGPLDDLLNVDEPALSASHRETLTVVRRNGQRLLKLVNTLLDFSRIEAGRMQASFTPVDLPAYTAELASVFRSAVERAGMRLDIDCGPLPEPVYVDRDMWEKIVLNLLSNAFKYTFEGEIRVSLRGALGFVELKVSDTGAGIPADEIPRLFNRFHRVEGARGRTHEGTGIGLALVHELAKLHGGSVRVESVVDVGSTFTVTVPLGRDHLPSDRIDASRTLSATTQGPGSYVEEALRWLPADSCEEDSVSRRSRDEAATAATIAGDGHARPFVVLADDNRDMRDYVCRLLSEQYEVAAVSDGVAALTAVRQRTPDLVITDVMMPNLDGMGLLETLRRDPKTRAIPVVMLSARAGEEARVEGLAAGADDYLVKPFSARELGARVASTLALSRARQEANRQERRQVEQLQSLAEAAVSVNAALSVEDSLRLVVERARTIVGARLGLAIMQTTLNKKRVVSAVSRSGDYLSDHNMQITPEEVGRCAVVVGETNKPLRRTHAELEADPDLRATPGEEEHRLALRGVLGAPLVARDGRNMGLILLTDKQEGEFSEADEAILVQVASLASVAVENGQFFKSAQEARAEAEAANRMKDQFLATLSHELRTPLNAILGWARILQMGPIDATALREGLETIERNSRVQAQLIEDLLDLSRIISGKLRLDVQRVVLVDVIEAALAAVTPAAEARNIRIQRVLDPLAGPVSGDPARLQQIVWNLLSNAVKFTPPGGRLQVLLERVNSHVEVSVSDTGQGIRPDFLPYVFDRFRQADASTTRRHGGLGLGLSIVRQLVEMHGGSVRAKSPGEGLGSTFIVALPISAAHRDAPERIDPRPAVHDDSKTPRTSLDGVKVLVVDDEPDARELVKRILMDRDAAVRTAGSVREALSALEAFGPDVLLSDIGMPEHDGYDLIRQVRARGKTGRELPAVALTAFARAEDRRRALLAGFQMHVAKPVDPEELVAAVATLVGRTGTV